MHTKIFRCLAPSASALIISLVLTTGARADSFWNVANGDWNTAANWNPSGVPNGVNAAINSGTANITANVTTNPNDILINSGVTNGTGAVNQSAGSITANGWLRMGLGSGGTANYTLSGGTLTAGQMNIGESSNAVFTMTGGTLNSNGEFWLSGVNTPNSTGTGTMNMSGGTVNVSSWLAVGRNGTSGGAVGNLNISGGTFNAATAGGAVTIGSSANATGQVTVSGTGTLTTPNFILVGENGTGTLTVSGSGLVNASSATNGVKLAANSGSTGTVNLNGGTIQAQLISKGAGTSGIFNFNGGTLKSLADNATFMEGLTTANVLAGGAFIDTNGKTIAINQQLLADAANRLLTKNGTGTLTLGGSGDNVNLGATVNAGTLVLGKASTSGIHALGGTTTVAGGTLQLGGSGGDQIYTAAGVVVNSGTFDLNGKTEGFNALSGSGGTITNTNATASTMTVGESGGSGSYAGNIVNGTGVVALAKNGAGTQTLTGSNTYTGTTDVNGGILAIGGGTTNTGTGVLLIHNATVNINGGAFSTNNWISIGQAGTETGVMNVSSGSVSAGGDFNVGDVGTSTGTLNVSGTGLVTASGASLYVAKNSGTAGTVNLDGGTVSTNHVGGTAASLTAATLGTSTFNFNGGTLQARTSDATFMQGLTRANVRNGGAVIDTNGVNITIGQALLHSNVGGDSATDGGLSKKGNGTLTLSGNNTFTGATTIATNGGTLVAAAAGALGGTSGITVNSGGTLLLAGAGAIDRVNNGAGLALAGGTLSMAGLSSSSETLGALTLSANSTIDFGVGNTNSLTFASLSLGAFNLVVTHWTGTYYTAGETTDHGPASQDRLLFTIDPSLNAAQLSQISFYNDAGNFIGTGKEINFGGPTELVPVPEPSTWIAGSLMVGLIGYRERRRLAGCFKRAV